MSVLGAAAAVLTFFARVAPVLGPTGVAGAPYNSTPAGNDTIAVTLDLDAASRILELLSAPRFDAGAAKALEEVPAVEAAIQESKRPADVFEHDLEAAFEEKSRITLFDFRQIRDERSRWKDLLAAIASRREELTRVASDRARALMPGDRPVTVHIAILLTFGLPSRADHLSIPSPDGSNWSVVIDVNRALSDAQGSSSVEQIQRLVRMMAQEAFQRAWAEYRAGSPGWEKRDATLGPLEGLLHRVAEAGPVALFSVDENFFPLAVWLKQPMRDSLDELNRVADRIVASDGSLDSRMAIAAEIQKPEFMTNVAGPAGAFLSDGIVQALGIAAYRKALSAGPRAFFEAYDHASQTKGNGLIPLSKTIRGALAGAPAPKKG